MNFSDISIILLLILFLYWRWRVLYSRRLRLKYQFLFFKLRDELRLKAINEKIEKDWVFTYLDSSISRTVASLSTFNILLALFTFIKYRNNTNIREFKDRFIHELDKNPTAKKIFEDYGKLMTSFILQKHFFFFFTLKSFLFVHLFTKLKIIKLRKRSKDLVEAMRFYPETSSIAEVIKVY